jgi:hypothetical protein
MREMTRIYKNRRQYLLMMLIAVFSISACKKVEHGLDESILSFDNSTPSSAFIGSKITVGLLANNVGSIQLSVVPAAGGESVYSATIENPDNRYILEHEIEVPADEAWIGDFLLRATAAGGQAMEKTRAITFTEGDPVFYLVGGSTSAGWEPSAGIPMRLYTTGDDDTSKDKFEIFVYLVAGDGGFKFLPTLAGWDGALGMASEGELTAVDGADNVTVDEDGFYRLRIDREALTYETLKTTWGIIGNATAGGWDADTDMTFDGGKGSYTWTITTDLTAGEMKFRANDAWDINLGGTEANLTQDGPNIQITDAGNYTITLTLHPQGYTARISKN